MPSKNKGKKATMSFLDKVTIEDLRAACPDCPMSKIKELKRICGNNPPNKPHGPTMQLLLEVLLSHELYGTECGSALPAIHNDIKGALRLYEAACFINCEEVAEYASRVIAEADVLCDNELVEEFLRRVPPKDPLMKGFAEEVGNYMYATQNLGEPEDERLEGLLEAHPRLMKEALKTCNRMKDTRPAQRRPKEPFDPYEYERETAPASTTHIEVHYPTGSPNVKAYYGGGRRQVVLDELASAVRASLYSTTTTGF
jgi:hypothetical protein